MRGSLGVTRQRSTFPFHDPVMPCGSKREPAGGGQVALVMKLKLFNHGSTAPAQDSLGLAEESPLSPKPQRAGSSGLKSAAHLGGVGIREIRALDHQDVDDLFHGINPCLRTVSATMAAGAGR